MSLLPIAYRKSPVFRSSQPVFCFIFSFGLAIMNLSSLLTLDASAFCAVYPYLFPLSFSLAFGSLILKVHRVTVIFGNRRLNKVIIRDADLYFHMLVLMSIDAVLLVINSFTRGSEEEKSTAVEQGIFYEKLECTNGPVTSVLYFSKILLLGTALYFAWVSRGYGHFAESQELGLSIYSLCLMAGIAAISSLFMEREGRVVLRSIVMFAGSALGSLLFYSKKVR